MFIPFVPFSLLSSPPPLASRSRYWLIPRSSFILSTAHEAPFAKDVGDMVCGLRNGPSDKTDNAAAASSVPSKRRLYFRTPLRVHWLLVVLPRCASFSKISPFSVFTFRSIRRKNSKRRVDLVYNATAAHRKHVADIFTNLRFVFSPGIKLG